VWRLETQLNSSQMNSTLKLLCTDHTEKQPLYCWEGVFTALLHNTRSYWSIACVFVAAEMCLPGRLGAMNGFRVSGPYTTARIMSPSTVTLCFTPYTFLLQFLGQRAKFTVRHEWAVGSFLFKGQNLMRIHFSTSLIPV
jgi:hypothetical protein